MDGVTWYELRNYMTADAVKKLWKLKMGASLQSLRYDLASTLVRQSACSEGSRSAIRANLTSS